MSQFHVPLLSLLVCTGCTSRGAGLLLTDVSQWRPVTEPANDPFSHEANSQLNCEPSGYRAEGDVLEVETDICSYATFSQPASSSIEAGEQLEFLIWHLTLWNESPAEAHVAIQIDDWLLWENRIEIPGAADVYSDTVTAPNDLERPTVFIHLHNHGANSWRFANIEVNPVLDSN